ncbi:hypothetical protein [Parvicella tangerina]|uniref:Uncharacterized protein n=1 Tax=Parvicella tangerina TaxID=2829795 RepID=A0A916NB45_9FLAO|nr:hypothetical protein [Parvicella tangerina]CAG5082201.1 hypothetical protein CRYO30217_01838 [Parvicella tangerina]
MNIDSNSLGGSPNKRKKAYTKEQINDLPDKVIVSNLMKMASFFKNNLNMDYSDAMKKARPLVDTDEGLRLIQKIKAQNGQQNSINQIAPVDLNQPVSESLPSNEERQAESTSGLPVKIQGIKLKNEEQDVLEPYTSNYFHLLDIIEDLEQRLKEQDLDVVSKKQDADILDLEFHYVCQNEDGTHLINMIQPDGEDEDKRLDLLVLLKVDPIRKMMEVMEYTDHNGNIHKVYSSINGQLHTNYSIKQQLNQSLTNWLIGFKTQAHKIESIEEQRENYIGSLQFYKDGLEDVEKFYMEEQQINKELKKKLMIWKKR